MAATAPDPEDYPKFARWLGERQIKNTEAAEKVGVAPESIRRYRLKFSDPGRRIPDQATMMRIAAWTGGAVLAEDWYPAPLRYVGATEPANSNDDPPPVLAVAGERRSPPS